MERGVYLLSRAQQIIINTRTYDHPPLFTIHYSLLTLLFALAAV
jgi:hypothetical protein